MKEYLCFFLIFFSPAVHTQTRDSVELFTIAADKFITDALDSLGVPALAVTIVRNDEIIYLRGFGHTDSLENIEANPETLFYVASCTKSFTGLAAALLDSKGLVRLDEPISRYFPDTKFDAALKADKITLRNLLTHTSGIQNDGIVFRTAYTGEYTFKQLVQLLAASDTNKAGHGIFEYSNIGYNAYSLVLMKALGIEWQELLSSSIFESLKMNNTTAYVSHLSKNKTDYARPYSVFGTRGLQKIALEKSDATMHAAGGMFSTAQDLAKWLRIQMNGGKLDGKQVFPDSIIKMTHRVHVVTNSDYGPFKRIGYGLGWYVGLYDQDTLIHHFGGFPGYHSHISFMPDKKIGIAILVNESEVGGRLASLLSTFSYDWWLKKPNVDLNYEQRLEKMTIQKKDMSEKIAADFSQRALRKWRFSVSIENLTGAYENSSYGRFLVKGNENSVSFRIAGLSCAAAPFKNPNSVRVELIPGKGEVITFDISNDGRVLSLQYDGKVFRKED
ncbi:beta-lactamase family protein [bacterium]|nr:beta-lactamase family protein [bacterium]